MRANHSPWTHDLRCLVRDALCAAPCKSGCAPRPWASSCCKQIPHRLCGTHEMLTATRAHHIHGQGHSRLGLTSGWQEPVQVHRAMMPHPMQIAHAHVHPLLPGPTCNPSQTYAAQVVSPSPLPGRGPPQVDSQSVVCSQSDAAKQGSRAFAQHTNHCLTQRACSTPPPHTHASSLWRDAASL